MASTMLRSVVNLQYAYRGFNSVRVNDVNEFDNSDFSDTILMLRSFLCALRAGSTFGLACFHNFIARFTISKTS